VLSRPRVSLPRPALTSAPTSHRLAIVHGRMLAVLWPPVSQTSSRLASPRPSRRVMGRLETPAPWAGARIQKIVGSSDLRSSLPPPDVQKLAMHLPAMRTRHTNKERHRHTHTHTHLDALSRRVSTCGSPMPSHQRPIHADRSSHGGLGRPCVSRQRRRKRKGRREETPARARRANHVIPCDTTA